MEECSYCGQSFDDEAAYAAHLADDHGGELGAIDRRRVEEYEAGTEAGDFPTGPLVLGVVFGVAVLLVVYVTLFMGSEGAPDVGQAGTAHEHGTVNVTVDGQTVDFSRDRYQVSQTGNSRFHFEGGSAVWHKHATGVTVEYALNVHGIQVSEDSVTVDGTTYRASDPGTEVVIEVNGEPVDPGEYVLQGAADANAAEQGDRIRVVVRTGES
ncbi:MAG: hypothetical protein ACI9CA_000972 [Natronomonas sp.]|jgi:hypothetical protein